MKSKSGKKPNQGMEAATPKETTSEPLDTTDMPLSPKPTKLPVAIQASPSDLAGNRPVPLHAPQTPMTPSATIFDPLRQPLLGAHSIEASAGTGKTYSITLLWLRLLVEEDLLIEEILVTTFTKAATAELKDRLLASLRRAIAAAKGAADGGPETKIIKREIEKQKSCPAPESNNEGDAADDLVRRLETALSNFDLAPIYTIHGFCQSMISRQVLELGADPEVELVSDCSAIRDQIVDDELMRQAQNLILDTDKMRRVAKDVSSNPLGMIPPRLAVGTVVASCSQMVAPILAEIQELGMNPVSLNAIQKNIQKTCTTGEKVTITKPQKDALGTVLPRLQKTLEDIRTLHGVALADYHSLAEKILQEYPQRKAAADLRTFDDILLTVYQALETENSPLAIEVRKRFRAAIIDECQDSDEIQIQIFRKLFLDKEVKNPGAFGGTTSVSSVDIPGRHGGRPSSSKGEASFGVSDPKGVKSFLVIGDPKQSIYRFRGADLASYRNLVGEATSAPEMKKNYRSDKPLVDAINCLYQKFPEFSDCLADGRDPTCYVVVEAATEGARIFDGQQDKPVVVLWSDKSASADARWALAAQTAAECHRLLTSNVEILDATSGKRRIQASDLAVLCATNNDLTLVRQALQRRGVACQMAGRGLGHILGSDEARDVLAWLCALSALERKSNVLPNLLAFCATPLCGKDASELADIQSDAAKQAKLSLLFSQELADLRWDGPLPLLLRRITEQTVQKVKNLGASPEAFGGTGSVRAVAIDGRHGGRPSSSKAEASLGVSDPTGMNLSHTDGERRLTNWRQIGAILQKEWFAGRHGTSELAQWMKSAMSNPSSEEDENMMKLETDLPAVQLVTIHSSKGLEYPVVFCPFLWSVKSSAKKNERPLAILRTPTGTLLDLGSDDFSKNRDLSITQEDEEGQRLLYVALTRARHRVYIGLAPVDAGGPQHANGAENSALAKLLGLTKISKDQWRSSLNDLPLAVNATPPDPSASASGAADGQAQPSAEALALAECPAPLIRNWNLLRCTSYSSLAKSAHEAETLSVRDHDDEASPSLGPSKEGLLKGLGSGIALGKEIHKVLEEILGNRTPIETVLGSRQKWQKPEWKSAVKTILSAPLKFGNETLRLSDVNGMAEMHFLIPSGGQFSASALSRAMLSDPAICGNESRKAWAEQLANWSFADLHGYLQGYMDLVFEHNGRWYVADYKSNQLPSYGTEELERTMLESHYLLQSCLYTLALHRHLRANLDGYSYDQHIGGTAWLFLRGFPSKGAWFERPNEDAIAKLDTLFQGNQP